jgi:hypothetical protein
MRDIPFTIPPAGVTLLRAHLEVMEFGGDVRAIQINQPVVMVFAAPPYYVPPFAPTDLLWSPQYL